MGLILLPIAIALYFAICKSSKLELPNIKNIPPPPPPPQGGMYKGRPIIKWVESENK